MAQCIKDPVLSLLWLGFDPWPRNFCILWAWPKKKKPPKNLGVSGGSAGEGCDVVTAVVLVTAVVQI